MADLSQIPTEDLLKMLQGPPQTDAGEAYARTARETSPGQAVVVGAGRKVDQILKGVRQVGGDVKRWATGGLAADPMAPAVTENNQIYDALKKEHPASTGFGEALPYAAVPTSIGPVAGAAAIAGGEGLQYGTPDERIMRAGVGGATALAGGVAGNVIGGLATGGTSGISKTKQQVLADMLNQGIKPRLSQITGNPYIARVEDWANRTTGGSGVMQDFARANEIARNKAAATSVGGKADEITPEFLAQTRERLGAVFNEVKALPGKPIVINSDVGAAADEVLRQQAKMIPGQQDQELIKLAQQAKTLSANNGRIDGESYQLIRSGLSTASYNAEGTTKTHYGNLLSALDNAAEESLRAAGNDKLAASLREARKQYANLTTLERGKVAAGGNINPVQLAAALRQNNPAAFREGRFADNPLVTIGREGETFPPLREGSQTYERGQTGDLLSTAVRAPLAYGAAKVVTNPIPSMYARLLNAVPGAPKFVSGITNPTIRAMVQALLQKPSEAMIPVDAKK